MSFQKDEEEQGATSSSVWRLRSNSSRLGFKGKVSLDTDNLALIYQLEFGVSMDDGNPVFTQRPTFLGIQGSFGKIIAGIHNTPLKKARFKVDLLNDTILDFKNMVAGENRVSNMIQYESPVIAGGFKVFHAMVLEKSVKEGEDPALTDVMSTQLRYTAGEIGVSLSIDRNIEKAGQGEDLVAMGFQWRRDGFQLGAFLQQAEYSKIAEVDKDDVPLSTLLSLAYDWGRHRAFGQFVSAEEKLRDGELWALGYQHRFSKMAKWYAFYGEISGQEEGEDYMTDDPLAAKKNTHAVVGVRLKF